jgi:xylulokinase
VTAVLAIDLGTSQVKVLCCSADGPAAGSPPRYTVLGQGTARYPIVAPRQGWAESDPELWWRAVRAAVRASAPAEVAAIALTGQMHGVVLCSERHSVLRPAILWLDRRAAEEAARYADLTGAQRAALANVARPGAAGPILLWLRSCETAVYEAARWQLQPKDWLRFRMTGDARTDPTDASGTLLCDVPRSAWAFDVISALGLRESLFAPVLEPASVAGVLLPDAAADLGLPAGVPVVTGCADTAASLHAAALPDRLWALLTLGTGGQWIMPVSTASPDPTGNTNLFRSVAGLYRLCGMQNVGVTLDWVRGVLGVTWDELYSAAGLPGRDGLRFEPWLVSERGHVPGGGWTGVTLAHRREDLLRAALGGVAGLLRDWLADLRAVGCAPEKVMIGGGGSRNPAWRDLLGETLGVPLYPVGTRWLSAHGAARLALTAISA